MLQTCYNTIRKAVPVLAMKVYGGMELWSHSFLIAAVNTGEWSASCTCRFTRIEQEAGEPQNRCGHFGEEKNLVLCPGIEGRY
jgi:hypothetical protein